MLKPISNAQWMIAAFLLTALVVGALLYKIIMGGLLGHTSLMFVGIPLVLALVLVLAPTPGSATAASFEA